MEENKNIQERSLQDLTGEKEPGSFRLIFTLGLAGFLSGVILVSAYMYTKPLIEANKAAAIEKAIYKVLPGCVTFQSLELVNGRIIKFNKGAKKENKKTDEPKMVYAGYDKSNALVGFAVLGAEPGFQDIIAVMMGYDPVKRSIIGFEVLESKETPGLGDKIFKDMAFQKNFIDLITEPGIGFAKKGEKHNANEVEAITGATISSKAVIRLLNNSMNEWKKPIEAYLQSAGIKSLETVK